MKLLLFTYLVLARAQLINKDEKPGLNDNCNESDDKCIGENLSCHGGKVWAYSKKSFLLDNP